MIPQKIQIKNFLSYGSAPQIIDFTHYPLICLSGKNGHGKSALLDAMTWAVWGQARKIGGSAKADQGLLRLGQTHMMVVFDFLLADKMYRIRREYMETHGKPISVLEFGILSSSSGHPTSEKDHTSDLTDGETDNFIPLTDKTIRTTQEKIEQIIRIDFDSFSNSAFLRQGSSNEFSKKSPKDRKQILATILGLDQYEVIRKLALDKTKEAITKKTALLTLQEKRMGDLATQETLDAQRTELVLQMNILTQIEKESDQNRKTCLSERMHVDEKHKEYGHLAFQLQQLQHTHAEHKNSLREKFSQWRVINKKKKKLHNVHQLEQEKNTIVTAIARHQLLLQESLEHRQHILQLTEQITAIEQEYKNTQLKKQHAIQLDLERMRTEHTHQQSQLTQQQQLIDRSTKEKNSAQAEIHTQQTMHLTLQANAAKITQQQAQLEKRKAAYQQFVSLGNWLSRELHNIVNKKKLVQEDDPSCPLCEQNLSAARRRFLKINFETQESLLAHRLQRLKIIIPRLKDILIEQHAAITREQEQLQQAALITTKIADLSAQLLKHTDHLQQSAALVQQIEQSLTAQQTLIEAKQHTIIQLQTQPRSLDHPEYQVLVEQKKTSEIKLQQQPYNAQDYKKDQEALTRIEAQLREYESVHTDITQQETRKNDIRKLCLTIKELNKQIATAENKQKKLGDLPAQVSVLEKKEKEIEQSFHELKQKKEILLHTKGSIENQQQYLSKIKDEYEKEKSAITQLDALIEDYHTIAIATGKDGIQALLIEEAIPEIEQEANYLLSRLTNNQAHIFIESLRDLKKGGTKETLDIKISDQAGIRPYELFSGGEAFRIDFALRIAISKLLARRAGTALQTLIIDEGFGSQDEEGLGYIMDALYKIQDDFSKIIIVSHLPSMKDQFPVQFLIEKGIQGSTVSIIEQG
jgi:DNA repair protein SbcC/Rad50